MSPLLFALYIDDLIQELNAKEVGVMYGDGMLSTLLYADDIVLIAPNELNLQSIITVVEKWCKTWQMSLNVNKLTYSCLLYTSPSPRDATLSRMPSSA